MSLQMCVWCTSAARPVNGRPDRPLCASIGPLAAEGPLDIWCAGSGARTIPSTRCHNAQCLSSSQVDPRPLIPLDSACKPVCITPEVLTTDMPRSCCDVGQPALQNP